MILSENSSNFLMILSGSICKYFMTVYWSKFVTRAMALVLVMIGGFASPEAFAQNAKLDYRATSQSKLQAARKLIQDILDEDAAPKRGFYGREPKFPVWKDQPMLDCAGYMIVRAIEAKEPYFEDGSERVAVVPVWAELLLVKASREGGREVKADGSTASSCAFEYERWSFDRRRFEKVDGFRVRSHYDEFPNWGESVINSTMNRWVAVDLGKRYVRFLARVSVFRDAPYQLAPQFPVHHMAEHSMELLRYYSRRKQELLREGRSDRDPNAAGDELQSDLQRMRKQLQNDSWAQERLLAVLTKLKNTRPFEGVTP